MRTGIPRRPASELVQHHHPTRQEAQPLPAPTGRSPYRATAAELGVKPGGVSLRLHVIGDSGGVKDPHPQLAVARALAADAGNADALYSVGDVVYFNGQWSEYAPQFFEPYADYPHPILAIPGNHDGDSEAGQEPSLQAFMRTFCDSRPQLIPAVEEYHRDTEVQPNCYWTLEDETAQIIGLYSNVPSGGQIDDEQAEWLHGELATAPAGVPLVIALHHPPYSADAHHGGSALMGEVIDRACHAAGRWPDMVLSGHVHNYQRFERQAPNGKLIPYLVVGNGGYHNLHQLAEGAAHDTELAPGVTLVSAFADAYGFLRLTLDSGSIQGSAFAVTRDGEVSERESFAYPVSS